MATIFREPARIMAPLPDGRFQVMVEWKRRLGIRDELFRCDLPESIVPAHLRSVGSRFVLILEDEFDPPGQNNFRMPGACRCSWRVEELVPEAVSRGGFRDHVIHSRHAD